jgi:hypothetical protein
MMNLKQKIALWAGVAVFVVLSLWPPSLYVQGEGVSWMEFNFIRSNSTNEVLIANLIAEWGAVAAITIAAVYTLRDEDEDEDE